MFSVIALNIMPRVLSTLQKFDLCAQAEVASRILSRIRIGAVLVTVAVVLLGIFSKAPAAETTLLRILAGCGILITAALFSRSRFKLYGLALFGVAMVVSILISNDYSGRWLSRFFYTLAFGNLT